MRRSSTDPDSESTRTTGQAGRLVWKRREIENYLCTRATLEAYASASAQEEEPRPLFAIAEVNRRVGAMREAIDEVRDAMETLGKGSPWSRDAKVSDDFLSPLFRTYFRKLDLPNLMSKKSFYELAGHVPNDEIDAEIGEKLDAIARAAGQRQPDRERLLRRSSGSAEAWLCPGLTLIIGGPGSGKTDEVVSRLAARYEADPFSETVVLVPTVRHGDQFRRRLVGRCGVALRLRVETIARLSRDLAPDCAATSLVPWPASSSSRTARREIERGPAAYFEPIAGTNGFADLLSAAVDDLLSEATRSDRALSEAAEKSGSPGLTALGFIFEAYSSELQRRGWLHPAQIALAAASAGRATRTAPAIIMLDGFQVFRGSELVLLEALADTSEVVATLDPWRGSQGSLRLRAAPRTVPQHGSRRAA